MDRINRIYKIESKTGLCDFVIGFLILLIL